MQIVEKQEPVIESQVTLLEEKLKISLPKDYRSFLQKVNAITIKTYQFKISNRDYYFSWFIPFKSIDGISLKSFNLQMKEHLKGEYFAFAFDHSNQVFLISLKDEEYGKIYFYRFDLELEDGLILLANSFNEFISILEKYE